MDRSLRLSDAPARPAKPFSATARHRAHRHRRRRRLAACLASLLTSFCPTSDATAWTGGSSCASYARPRGAQAKCHAFSPRLRGRTSGSRDINSASTFRPQAVASEELLERVDRVAERRSPVAATPSATVPAASPALKTCAGPRASLARFASVVFRARKKNRRLTSGRRDTASIHIHHGRPLKVEIAGAPGGPNLARAALRALDWTQASSTSRSCRWVAPTKSARASPRFCSTMLGERRRRAR